MFALVPLLPDYAAAAGLSKTQAGLVVVGLQRRGAGAVVAGRLAGRPGRAAAAHDLRRRPAGRGDACCTPWPTGSGRCWRRAAAGRGLGDLVDGGPGVADGGEPAGAARPRAGHGDAVGTAGHPVGPVFGGVDRPRSRASARRSSCSRYRRAVLAVLALPDASTPARRVRAGQPGTRCSRRGFGERAIAGRGAGRDLRRRGRRRARSRRSSPCASATTATAPRRSRSCWRDPGVLVGRHQHGWRRPLRPLRRSARSRLSRAPARSRGLAAARDGARALAASPSSSSRSRPRSSGQYAVGFRCAAEGADRAGAGARAACSA